MRWQIAAAALAALVCLGFAEPPAGPEFARLDFERSFITGGKKPKALTSGFNVLYGPACERTKYAGFGPLTGSKRSLQFPGDTPLFIHASAGDMSKICQGFITFKAERGHAYAVKLEATAKECILDVVDSATGRQPADLRFLHGPQDCIAVTGGQN